jgi:hypothetical protein
MRRAHQLAGVLALCSCWGCLRGVEPGTETDQPTGDAGVRAWDSMIASSHREEPQPAIEFSHHVEGDQVVVEIERSDVYSSYTCGGDENELEKREGNTWVPVRDERPLYDDNPGYYLDGEFVPASMTEGRVWSCIEQPAGTSVVTFPAYEYLKTGQAAPPPDAEGSPAEVDVIEARPLSGQVRATIRYFTDTKCAAASSHSIELTIARGGA